MDFNTDSLIQQVLRKEAGKQCFGWFVSVNFCGVAVSDSWGCGPWTWDVYAATPQTPTALAPSPSGFLEVWSVLHVLETSGFGEVVLPGGVRNRR